MIGTYSNYDVKCILCGTEVGQVIDRKFRQHAGCKNEMPRKNGMARCCHCGGSLFLDPSDTYPTIVERARIATMASKDAA